MPICTEFTKYLNVKCLFIITVYSEEERTFMSSLFVFKINIKITHERYCLNQASQKVTPRVNK